MNQPTVTVTYDCEACGGTGRVPPVEQHQGRARSVTPGGPCDACLNEPGPDGKIEKQATLWQLKQLLAKAEGPPA